MRDLTPESHGNAIGIGMADFTTDRLVTAMDPVITRVNALTALSLQGAKIPIHFPTDREALATALQTLCLPDPAQARMARIRDTLDVEQLEFSEPLRETVRHDCPLEEKASARPLQFDARGNLLPLG